MADTDPLREALERRMEQGGSRDEIARFGAAWDALTNPETAQAPMTPADRVAMAEELGVPPDQGVVPPSPEYGQFLHEDNPETSKLRAFAERARAAWSGTPDGTHGETPQGTALLAPPRPDASSVFESFKRERTGVPMQEPAAAPAQESPVQRYARTRGLGQRRAGGGSTRLSVARGELAGAEAEAEAARNAQIATLQDIASEARTQGALRATEQLGFEQEYVQGMQEFDAQRQETEAELTRRTADSEAAINAFMEEAMREKPAKALGSKIVSAIAIGLGAFGTNRTGNQNPALQVIREQVDAEAAARAERLGSLKTAIDVRDKLVKRAFDSTQSVEAARQTFRAGLFDRAALQAERYAALRAGADEANKAQLMIDALRSAAAEARLLAKQATLIQVQKSMRGPSQMQRLKLEAQALNNAKLAQELNNASQSFGADPEMTAKLSKDLQAARIPRAAQAAREVLRLTGNLEQLPGMATKLKTELFRNPATPEGVKAALRSTFTSDAEMKQMNALLDFNAQVTYMRTGAAQNIQEYLLAVRTGATGIEPLPVSKDSVERRLREVAETERNIRAGYGEAENRAYDAGRSRTQAFDYEPGGFASGGTPLAPGARRIQ